MGAWVRIRARTCVCTCVCASARAHVCGRCACVYVRARARAVTQSSVRGDSCGASCSRDDSIRKISTRASLLNRRTCTCARACVGVNVCALCMRACIEFESARYHVCVDTLHGWLSLHRTFDGACDRTLDGNIPSSAHVGQAASSLLQHIIYHDVPAACCSAAAMIAYSYQSIEPTPQAAHHHKPRSFLRHIGYHSVLVIAAYTGGGQYGRQALYTASTIGSGHRRRAL